LCFESLKELEVALEVVGVTGDVVSLMGEVGESKSLEEPVESFVRFFLRNPRVGIEAVMEECCPALAWPGGWCGGPLGLGGCCESVLECG
jgi:hypothetical protein